MNGFLAIKDTLFVFGGKYCVDFVNEGTGFHFQAALFKFFVVTVYGGNSITQRHAFYQRPRNGVEANSL